jgi:hypothetical protein
MLFKVNLFWLLLSEQTKEKQKNNEKQCYFLQNTHIKTGEKKYGVK